MMLQKPPYIRAYSGNIQQEYKKIYNRLLIILYQWELYKNTELFSYLSN